MKVFKSVGMTARETEELLGEAILLSRLGHPNIIRVFDANVLDTAGGSCGYFTMEYVAGGSLERHWRSFGAALMPIPEIIHIIRQLCSGLAAAHAEDPPIIHRNIKPQNVMIGYDAGGLRARIRDFGLARKVNPLTLMASAHGTLGFKPPESMYNMDSCAADDSWAGCCGITTARRERGRLHVEECHATPAPRRARRPLSGAWSIYMLRRGLHDVWARSSRDSPKDEPKEQPSLTTPSSQEADLPGSEAN